LLALTLRVAVFLVGNVGLRVTSWGYISGSGCCDWVKFQKIGNIYYSNNEKRQKKGSAKGPRHDQYHVEKARDEHASAVSGEASLIGRSTRAKLGYRLSAVPRWARLEIGPL
jgi:hypothetical protein